MNSLIRTLLQYRVVVLVVFIAALLVGCYAYTQLDIEAYPDPSPPLVEIITQNPAWSAEEMEQQVTIPVENAVYGSPHLEQVRSTSIFGLSDVKLYFSFDSDYFHDREEVLYHLQTLNLPNNLQPQLSPTSPIGEIYRYVLTGPGYSSNEIKATQDWLVTRELKQVPGIIDVTTFGGTTRQYQVIVDPNLLLAHNVTLTQVVNAIQNSNANVGRGLPYAGCAECQRAVDWTAQECGRHRGHRRRRTRPCSRSGAGCGYGQPRESTAAGSGGKKQ